MILKQSYALISLWKISKNKGLFLLQIVIHFLLSYITIYISQMTEMIIDQRMDTYLYKELAVKFLILVMTGIIFHYLLCYAKNYFGINLVRCLREMGVKKMMTCKYECLDKEHSGKIINKLSQDVSKVSEYISGGLPDFIENVIVFFCSFSYLMYVNWKMTGICVICVPVTIWLTKKYARLTYETMDDFKKKLDETIIMVKDTIQNIKIEKVFEIQKIRILHYDRKMDEAVANYISYEKCMSKTAPIKYLIDLVPILICVFIGFINVYMQNVTKGELVAFVLLIGNISSPMAKFLGFVTEYKEAAVSMDRVVEVLNLPEEEEK